MSVAVACLLMACSSGGDGEDAEEGAGTTVSEREGGPVATLEPLAGGNGVALATAGGGPSLEGAGYVESEHAAAGVATSYTGETPPDGVFDLEPAEEADYATRVVVRRPVEASAFNGTVVVEWLNVSGGADAAPDYTYLAEELLRGGYVWVGVSAQHVGIEGGEAAVAVDVPEAEAAGVGQGLRAQDPERYGDLRHPGDAFSYDIYTQVARAMRAGAEDGPLEGLEVERLLAVGESQSAFALTTYVNGVQPLTGAFDGFLVHSRGGPAAPLGEPGTGIDITAAIAGEPTTVRTDGDAPVIVVQTESDVLGVMGYLPARQPDADRFRLWEVAGTAHADRFQVGATEEGLGCAQPINRGQQVFVLRAALRHLDTWVAEGAAPPDAPRLAVDEAASAFEVDPVGNVEGGIRSPAVEAPVDVLSGMPAEGASLVCMLMGSTTPVADDQLTQLYASSDEYLDAYESATDAMIDAGFALADDREQILDGAQSERIPTG